MAEKSSFMGEKLSFKGKNRVLTFFGKIEFPSKCTKKACFVQKLKKIPKTQGKISKNLKFPANPLASKAGKTSKKKPEVDDTPKK